MAYLTHDDSEERGWQDTALVCLNGHMVNNSMKRSPQCNTKFCERCGEEAIWRCMSCGQEIRGDYHYPGVFGFGLERPPAFCHNCGQAYPWADKARGAAKELIGLADDLSPTEKEDFDNTVGDLMKEGPRTPVAAEKFRRYCKRAGKAVGEGIWKIVIDVASETAKKILIPGP